MGGGGSQTQTQQTGLPDWAQPYAKDILARGSTLSKQDMPVQGVAGFTDGQNSALGGIQKLGLTQNPMLQSAMGSMQDMQGASAFSAQNPYARMNNPYLDQQVNKAQGDLTNQYQNAVAPQTMAQFRSGGAFGGSAMQQTQDMQNRQLVNGLNDVSSTMRGNAYAGTQAAAGQQAALDSQNYQANQQNKLSAAGLAPALNESQYSGLFKALQAGGMQQHQNQSMMNQDYQKKMSPYNQLDWFKGLMNPGITGQQTTSTTSQSGGNGAANLMGIGSSAMGMYSMYQNGQALAALAAASDRRLKENIVHHGVHKATGLNIYDFNYIGQKGRYRGVMADEVEKVKPEAVMRDGNGIASVNYAMLGIPFEKVGD